MRDTVFKHGTSCVAQSWSTDVIHPFSVHTYGLLHPCTKNNALWT